MITMSPAIEFLNFVEGSQLLSAEQLGRYRPEPTSDETPQEVATKLVTDGLLTQFQAKVLLKGKQQSFFLTPKYKILDHLGTGGMGRVYLCEHMILQRLVAVKVLTATPSTSGAATTGQGIIERFYREARAVAALDHRNIIRVFDVEQTRGAPFMVMEYVDGIDLDKYVAAHGPLEPNRAADYIRQAAEGLEHAHQAGLIHRDVKPSNLLLDRTGAIRLLDLGLARFLVDSRRNQGVTEQFDANVILGTVDYMAPEQAIDSSRVDIRADVYSLGCTLYYLLTGKPVFEAEAFAQKMLAHQMRDPRPIRESRSDVPAGLEAVAKMMMAKKPENRFQTPADVVAALNEFVVPPPSLPDTARMPKMSARSFQLGLCPAPTARPLAGSGSQPVLGGSSQSVVALTATRAQRGNSSSIKIGPNSEEIQDTPRGMLDTLQDDKPLEVVSEGVAKRGSRKVLWGLAALLVLGVGAGVAFLGGKQPVEPVVKPADDKPVQKADPGPKPPVTTDGPFLTPAEAAKKVGERVTVQFTVGSFGGKSNMYLNSQRDFTAKENFAVVLSSKVQTGKWSKPTPEMFVGKTIRATGFVKVFKDAPQLELADQRDLEFLEK